MVDLILESVRLHHFTLPLKRSFNVANASVATRQGVLLTVTTDSALTASGEASPLPGLHSETIGTVVTELKKFKQQFTGRTLIDSPRNVKEALQNVLNDFPASPSVRFAVETLFVGLWAQQAGKSVAQYLSNTSRQNVRLNALLWGELQTMLQQSAEFVALGFRSLKIKVGRHAPQDELAQLKRLLQVLPPSVQIRLDANRLWTLEQAKTLQSLPRERIEYVEEALQNPNDIPAFYQATGLPVALDESLKSPEAHTLLNLEGVKALVLKPTVLGAIQTLQWAQLAQKHRQKIIISDTFSSGIGINNLAHWAAALNYRTAHGLHTYALLTDDVLNPRLTLKQGRLKLLSDKEIYERIQWSKLSEL